jgi:hypothetical protein
MDTFCSVSLRNCQQERTRDKKQGWSQEQTKWGSREGVPALSDPTLAPRVCGWQWATSSLQNTRRCLKVQTPLSISAAGFSETPVPYLSTKLYRHILRRIPPIKSATLTSNPKLQCQNFIHGRANHSSSLYLYPCLWWSSAKRALTAVELRVTFHTELCHHHVVLLQFHSLIASSKASSPGVRSSASFFNVQKPLVSFKVNQ